jgi:hypothetical protein
MDGKNALAGRYLLVAVRTMELTYAEGRQAEPFEAARRQ